MVFLSGGFLGALPSLPDYQVGQQAETEIITPIRLLVVDPEQTQEQRQQELRKIPLIFRYCPDADVTAEGAFRSAFVEMRGKFLGALETNLGRRVLLPQGLKEPRFQRFLTHFTNRNKAFPWGSDLVRLWTQGQSDAAIQTAWSERLRAGMERWIRPDRLPADLKWNGIRVRLYPLPRHSPSPDVETVLRLATPQKPTNWMTLTQARRDFRAGFSAEEQALGAYLATFLSENCVLEEVLSRQVRENRAATVWAARRYEVGDVLVRKGQTIDLETWRALRELKHRTQPGRGINADPAAQDGNPRPARSRSMRDAWFGWLVVAGDWVGWTGLILAGAGGLLLWRIRRAARWRSARFPARVRSGSTAIVVCPSCSSPVRLSEAAWPEWQSWRQRALDAERRARTAVILLRSNLMSGLTYWVKGKMMQALLGRQESLHAIQEQAEREIRDLAGRLAAAQAPLEERLKAYQTRIAELEHQLAVKAEENRELIRAQLGAVRKQLRQEQGKPASHWN